MAKLTKEEKAARRKERKAAGKGLWDEFKAFINKGNAFMLAVGVVIGGAFSAIVTAFVNILTSLATWPVPGGLKGLVTVLPAVTDPQKGAAMQIGGETVYKQFFSTAEVNDMVIAFAKAQGVDITTQSDTFVQWKNSLLGLYTLHGTTWTYNMSAIIDWGSLINAIIAFIIIALVLFAIVKAMAAANEKKAELEAKRLELYYPKHPEERPAPVEEEAPKPTTEELLTAILAEMRANKKGGKKETPAKVEAPAKTEEPAKE